jgi:hypothetical protein
MVPGRPVRWAGRGLAAALVVLVTWTAPAGVRAEAGQAWWGDTPDSAPAAAGQGTAIHLFYGSPLPPELWSSRDRAALQAALASGTAGLTDLYNQWLAIADLRAALYEAGGTPAPAGVTVYPLGVSAALHALDLALWAREEAIVAVLGGGPAPPYPDFASLGYRDGGAFVGAQRQPSTLDPARVAAVLRDLGLPPALLAGDRVFLLPYRMPQEYGVTDVLGPDIRVWIGADADQDLRHVLAHELGHAIHFRFGGYDSVLDPAGNGRPLSAFWQQYLTMRGLAWSDPALAPWSLQTPECFAEDVARLATGAGDPLGYQAACPPPTDAQLGALRAWLRDLAAAPPPATVFQQAQWVRWTYPWPASCFGHFQAVVFTAEPQVTVSLALDGGAAGGPYTVQLAGQAAPLGTLAPGASWTGTVPVPQDGQVEVQADSPTLILSSLEIYRRPEFVPEPRLSGVFPDTLDHWSRAVVAAAVRIGVVGGYPDGTFLPDVPVDRAEFARMLAAALPARLFARSGRALAWPDVPPGYWAEPFIAAVGPLLPGVTAGAPFRPAAVLTREEGAAWVTGAFGWTPLSPERAQAVLAAYPDGAAADPAEAGRLAAAVSLGLLVGDAGSGTLRPTAPLTRAEAAVLVLRAVDLAAATQG